MIFVLCEASPSRPQDVWSRPQGMLKWMIISPRVNICNVILLLLCHAKSNGAHNIFVIHCEHYKCHSFVFLSLTFVSAYCWFVPPCFHFLTHPQLHQSLWCSRLHMLLHNICTCFLFLFAPILGSSTPLITSFFKTVHAIARHLLKKPPPFQHYLFCRYLNISHLIVHVM